MANNSNLADASQATIEMKKNATTEIQQPADEQGSLPSLPDITSIMEAASNPLAAAQQLVSLLPVPNFLPSINPGSFTQLASLASSSGSFEPAQIFAQAQQLKQIICNFVPPNIKMPDFDKMFDVSIDNIEEYFKNAFKGFADIDPGKMAEDLGKQILKQLEEQFNEFTSLFTECQKDEEST